MNVQIEEGWKKALAPEFEKDYFVRLTDFVRQEYPVRGTSCFVIKFGKAGEQIAKEMWEKEGKMVYASSANPCLLYTSSF